MSHFEGCKTLPEGRDLYRKLLVEHHPDKWPPSEKEAHMEIYKQIQIDFEAFLKQRPANDFVKDFHQTQNASARAGVHHDQRFWDALQFVMGMNVDVEVIGGWIHVTNYVGRDVVKLTFAGFWYSVGHQCMIWSPDEKKRIKPAYTTDELRSRWGSEKKREKRTI